MTSPQSLLEQLSGNKIFPIIEDQEFGNLIFKPAEKTSFHLFEERTGLVMDDHNLNEEQLNKWKQLVEIMGEESGNVAMYNWVMSHLKNENGLTEKDLQDYQQVKLKELRKKSFEKRSSEDFCRWLLGEKVVSETLDIVRSITHSDGGDI